MNSPPISDWIAQRYISETMSIPKVSIGAAYLPEAIEVLLAHDNRDFKLFNSDNAFTDTTEEACRA